MDKLILMSILFATVAIPAVIAREPKLDLALKRLFVYMALFLVLYALLCCFVYLRVVR